MVKQSIPILSILILLILMFNTVSYATQSTEGKPIIKIPREWIGKSKIVEERGDYIRIVYIHYGKPAKPDAPPGKSERGKGGLGDVDSDGYLDGYKTLRYKWKLENYPEGIPYIINPNNLGLNEELVVREVKYSFEVWDIAVDLADYNVDYITYESYPEDKIMYNVELFAEPTVDYTVTVNLNEPDGNNVVTWAFIDDPNVIAVTYLWVTRVGREIVEFDMVFNTNHNWGIADGNETTNDLPGKMDIRNIATHEAGHVAGLDDLYQDIYKWMTMYGYGDYGEEIKRSIEPGDIAGAQDVYEKYRG